MSRQRPSEKEFRVAPQIYRSRKGWRVYIRREGKRASIRFKPDITIEQLQSFVATANTANATFMRERRDVEREHQGTFGADADRYLELKTVKAMPSYVDRTREITKWKRLLGKQARQDITARKIDEQLQAMRDAGLSASTVNKHRTALMSLWTRLDGRDAANPVRGTRVFEEPAAQPRGVSYDIIRRLLDAMPRDQSRPVKDEQGSRARGSKTQARLALMAWTGMTPIQISQLTPRDVNVRERWYLSPPRGKGSRRPRHPRPIVRKPMTADSKHAFQRFIDIDAWGPFDCRSLRRSLERAHKKVQDDLRTIRKDPAYELPHIRVYDFRHSFGTELFRRTKDLTLVAEMLDHSSLQMTKRYSLGAMADVLKAGMRQFQEGTRRRAAGNK